MFGIDDAVSAVASIGGKLIDRFIPDPAAAAQAKLDLLKMQQTGELAQLTADTDVMKAQAAINEAEADSSSVFVSGWRPAVGWTCAVGIGVQFLGPLFTWASTLAGHPAVFPVMDSGTLMPLLFGMLGLGGMRTFEKVTGVKSSEPSDAVGRSTKVGG